MTKFRTKRIAKENGWYQSRHMVFGLYRGYFFTVVDSTGPILMMATLPALSQEVQQHLERRIAESRKAFQIGEFSIHEQGVTLKLKERFTYTRTHHLYDVMNFLTESFEGQAIAHSDCCHQCASHSDLNYYCLGDYGAILCSSCAQELSEGWQATKKECLAESKNYLRGTLGTVLFSLPGAVLWVILALYFSRLATVIAFMAPLLLITLSMRGYARLGGRPGRWMPWLIILVNIVFIVAANYATVVCQLYQRGYSLVLISQGIAEVANYLKLNIPISLCANALMWLVVFLEQHEAAKFPEFGVAKPVT
jgi:hypothetical protein